MNKIEFQEKANKLIDTFFKDKSDLLFILNELSCIFGEDKVNKYWLDKKEEIEIKEKKIEDLNRKIKDLKEDEKVSNEEVDNLLVSKNTLTVNLEKDKKNLQKFSVIIKNNEAKEDVDELTNFLMNSGGSFNALMNT